MPRFAAEAPWAWRLLARYLRELPASRRTETPGREPLVEDAGGEAPVVLVQADPEAYMLPEVALRLLAGVGGGSGPALVLPVSNEAEADEARRAPAFAYLTPTLLSEAVRLMAASAGPSYPAAAPASPVYAVSREALGGLPPRLPLWQVPRRLHELGRSAVIDPGAYVHRYGAMDASSREDLAGKVPAGAAAVLDVGCSRGATAAALRARGVRRIVGIEPDAGDAAAAALVYDEVFASRLQDVTADPSGRFDAVLFGDVLEHLEDPSDALSRVRPWLASGGALVASVPNVGHWSIVDDLLRGRFDYVPYSLLSGTHVRFFTRSTLTDLFEGSGYRVVEIDALVLPPSPDGARRLDRLRAFPGASQDLDVAEFLAVARADR